MADSFWHNDIEFQVRFFADSWIVKNGAGSVVADHPNREIAIAQAKEVIDHACVCRCDFFEARVNLGYR